ncbi:hypothetical protein U2F26_05485 [Micromonospora sp. 4G57]|uniref:Uncharacterized protein n=1 Tax=Micromonospora sicca TaxID=2202420 RepID=A0ABU5JI81_9ACTN|nr:MULTISPECIES: hypothetical protein [unclassified Micromonospora]MDZ5442187.1 hypothetical protein [Micromonospora sp. 4G57]MDZ5492134.1 hypothetical protein [Micromonospora sp. 4G53]
MQVAEVFRDCAEYFHRNPYRRWFDPLDSLLDAGTGTSYYRGNACHLDLVQWATDPVWGRIKDSTVRRALLEDGVPHLRAQLRQESIRLVLLNGRTVVRQVQRTRIADLAQVGVLPLGATTCALFSGQVEHVQFLGWSANLQSSFGVSKGFRRRLGEWLAEQVAEGRFNRQALTATSVA